MSFFKGEEGGVVRCPMPCLPRSLVLRAAGCKPAMYAYHKGWLISESGEHEDIEGRKKKIGSGTQAAQLSMRVFWMKVLPVQVAEIPSLHMFLLYVAVIHVD